MIWWVVGSVVVVGLVTIGGLLADAGVRRAWHSLQRVAINRYLLRHPEAGELQMDGSYNYRRGPFIVSYLYHPDLRPPHHLLWLTTKQRISPWELSTHRLLRQCRMLCSRDGLAQLWDWRTGGVLLVTLLLCWRFTESETARLHRWEWVVARTLGLNLAQVQVNSSGWVVIRGVRRTSPDQSAEPVTFVANPVRWLAGGRDVAYVIRYRGNVYGYVVHPVSFGDRADIWLRKYGTWRSGRLEGNRIVWQQPEGTGVRAGVVREQRLPNASDLTGHE